MCCQKPEHTPGTLPVSQNIGARKTQDFRIHLIGDRDTESQQGPDMSLFHPTATPLLGS